MSKNSLYSAVYLALCQMLAAKKSPRDIEKHLPGILRAYQPVYPGETVDPEKLLRDVLYSNSVFVGNFTVLEDTRDHKEWLANEKTSIEWGYYKRYENYLRTSARLPFSVIDEIDESTDEILRQLESPRRPGSWDRRGMVVGSVQAGKTGNYIGLICKAVDAGYKVIVVLAGLNNDLRSQTQKRIDKGFLGKDTSKKDRLDQSSILIGAGLLPSEKKLKIVHAYTNSLPNGDLRKSIYKNVTVTPGGDPLIVVIKKNKTPLTNLLDWFTTQNESKKIHNVPLLLIDDEADNASIDTKAVNRIDDLDYVSDEHDPTKINALIRQILNAFSQSAYVGYTATPFANIFIYPEQEHEVNQEYGEDLFPRSFIVNLKSPSNYLGPEKLFGLTEDEMAGIDKEIPPLPLIRRIDDFTKIFSAKHDKNLKVRVLPDSLIKAIYAFILSSAARYVRGQDSDHHSMLVHVTRFVSVQEQVVTLIRRLMKDIVNQLGASTTPKYEALMMDLRLLWHHDFEPTTEQIITIDQDPLLKRVSWDQVQKILYKVASKIEVKAINGQSADGGLNYDDYPEGCSVIAVGGDKLSRGLTLEGLSVSYYTRTAKMYDTLMQMGRWFGYRDGYLDLCRLYTSADLVKAYRHITIADYELRKELDNMAYLNAIPETYGLKVRTDPAGVLWITAKNKMRNSEERVVTYSGKLVQLTKYYRKSPVNHTNVEFLNSWVETLGEPNLNAKSCLWTGVKPEKVLTFISNLKIHPECFVADPNVLCNYIRQLNKHGELIDWTVALISTNGESRENVASQEIGLSWRTDATPEEDTLSILNNQLIKESDESIDLSKEEYLKAMELTLQRHRRDKEPSVPSPVTLRKIRSSKKGLIMIYLFESGTKDSDGARTPYDDKYVGYAISFPESGSTVQVVYKVDKTFIDSEFGYDF